MVGPFALLCSLVILGGWLFLIRDWIVSAAWKTVPGTVRGVDLAPDQRAPLSRPWQQVSGFRPIIRYAYDVDDQTYVGERFSATRGPFFATEEEGNAYLERFPLHARLTVKVDPNNPRQALLQRQLSLSDALPGYIGLGCMMVAALSL